MSNFVLIAKSLVLICFLIDKSLSLENNVVTQRNTDDVSEQNHNSKTEAAVCGSVSKCPKDVKSSNIAQKAAEEAKQAQEAQTSAGAQAARQVKIQLAEKAIQAARAAEVALYGKMAMVGQLEHEFREAQSILGEEVCSFQKTYAMLQNALVAAAQATYLLKSLATAVQVSQSNCANTHQVSRGIERELSEKSALVEAAKTRVNALFAELNIAKQDLCATRDAANKALMAARSAECNAQRNKRRLSKPLQKLLNYNKNFVQS